MRLQLLVSVRFMRRKLKYYFCACRHFRYERIAARMRTEIPTFLHWQKGQ